MAAYYEKSFKRMNRMIQNIEKHYDKNIFLHHVYLHSDDPQNFNFEASVDEYNKCTPIEKLFFWGSYSRMNILREVFNYCKILYLVYDDKSCIMISSSNETELNLKNLSEIDDAFFQEISCSPCC